MGTSSCIFIYYKNKFYVSQTSFQSGYVEEDGVYIFKFLSSPDSIAALKRGLEHISYISQNNYETAKSHINNMDKSELRDAWRSFCTDYASKEPESRHVIHKYVDACSGPAVLKLISAATAEKKVKLVHPASITDPEALNKITVVHPKLLSKIDEEDFDIESFDNDEMGDEKFDIDSFVMDDDFHIGHFDIDWHDFAYMIDLDKSTFEIYDPESTKPVCKYTFADLERLTEAEFIGRYYKDIEEEEDPDNTPQYRFLLAGSFGRHSHKTITSELAGKFQFCSTVGDHPTHLVCTQREYDREKPMKKVLDAWNNGIPICDAKILSSQAMKADVENYILWPKHDSS